MAETHKSRFLVRKFGENGKEIVSQITSEMGKVIKVAKHVEYLKKLDGSLKEMLGLWYELMTVMKSVNRQTRQDIAKFKANTIAFVIIVVYLMQL